eukprot:283672-Rhodomonas_salina.1
MGSGLAASGLQGLDTLGGLGGGLGSQGYPAAFPGSSAATSQSDLYAQSGYMDPSLMGSSAYGQQQQQQPLQSPGSGSQGSQPPSKRQRGSRGSGAAAAQDPMMMDENARIKARVRGANVGLWAAKALSEQLQQQQEEQRRFAQSEEQSRIQVSQLRETVCVGGTADGVRTGFSGLRDSCVRSLLGQG